MNYGKNKYIVLSSNLQQMQQKSPEIYPFWVRVNQKFTFGFTVNAKQLTINEFLSF